MVCKSKDPCSHFIVTGERGGGGRKCTLKVVTTTYCDDFKHDGGSEERRSGSKLQNECLANPRLTGQRPSDGYAMFDAHAA